MQPDEVEKLKINAIVYKVVLPFRQSKEVSESIFSGKTDECPDNSSLLK